MKNLFAFSKDLSINNYNQFIVRKISAESDEKFNSICEEGDNLAKTKLAPSWLMYGSLIAAIIALMGMVAMFAAKDGFMHALETRGFVFYICCGVFVVGLIIFILCYRKTKKGYVDPEVGDYLKRLNTIVGELFSELEVPDSATRIDVFLEYTKLNKSGEQKPKKLLINACINQELHAFVEKDLFCLADSGSVIGIPVDSFKGIKKINKIIQFPRWNKDVDFRSSEFKPYKVYFSNGNFACKPYYEIDFEIEGEEHYFYIPGYDKERFVRALGIQLPEINASKK